MPIFDSDFDKNLHVQEAVLTQSELNKLNVSEKNIPANTFVFSVDKNTDTITVTLNDLLKKRTVVIEVKKGEGEVILFKAKDQEGLIQSRISFKFWGKERQGAEKTHYLHSKGKIIFGKKIVNENIPVISPVTGKLEVKLRKYVWIVGVVGTVAFFIFTIWFFF